MVVQHKENFASWDNITKFGSNQSLITTNSNPLLIELGPTTGTYDAGIKTSSLPSVFSGANALTYYCRFWIGDDDGNNFGGSQQAYLFDGTTYVRFGKQWFASNMTLRLERGTTLRGIDSGDAFALSGFHKEWIWLKVTIVGTLVTLNYNKTDNTLIKPDNFNDGTLTISLAGALGTITEIGVHAFTQTDVSFGKWDDLEIISGEGIPIDNATFGDGTGGTIKLSSVYVKKTVGQVGSNAKLTYHDPLLTKASQVEGSHRTVTTISETRFNTRLLQGEIVNTDTSSLREIIVNGVEAKLSRIIAAYDPVFTRGVVEYIEENVMYKQNVGTNKSPVFSSYGTLTDKLVVFIKKHQRRYQCGVKTILVVDSGDNVIVPDLVTGSRLNLFFDAPDESDANRGLYYRNDGRFFVTLEFQAIVKDTSVVDKALFNIGWKTSSHLTLTNAAMNLWDYTNSVWRTFTRHEHVDWTTDTLEKNDDGFTESMNINQQVDIANDITTGVFADYSNVSAANTYGWKTHTFKIRLDSGAALLPVLREIIHLEKVSLVLDLDIDQQYQVGVAKIQTVNDHNLVFYANAGISWLDEDIRNDGISGGGVDDAGLAVGDEYYITDKISDILEALWVASGADQIMNLNVVITSEIPDIEDLRRVMILQYVQKVSELQGLIYFTSYTTDPTNDLPTFNITDTPVDSGLILTPIDFIEPLTQTTYKIDSSKELSTLKLVAKNGIIGTVSISSEHTPELGLETVLVARPDIHTARQAGAWLSKKKLLYTNAYRYFSCRINYDRASQDYSLLDIGKEVSVKNPANASIVDHQTGTNGRLLIYQLELNRNWNNGYSNYITLILQQRFA